MASLFYLVPAALAALLLAAHFYRADALWGVALATALFALLFVRKPWSARVVQAGLVLGTLEWLRVLAAFAAVRLSFGQPWLRMALILGAVALLTALAALAFESKPLRARYRLPSGRRGAA
jgi:hypothetical protein